MTIQRPTDPTPLQRERHRRGWTQADVVDRLNALADKLGLGELGIDANAVSRHERGVIRRPRPPLPDLYARLYGRPVHAIVARRQAGHLGRPRSRRPRRGH